MRSALLLAAILAISCTASAPAPGASTVTPFVIPTRSPAPSVSPTAFAGHYGFLVETTAGYALSREGDSAVIATIPLARGAVSPDGRRFAGFTRAAPYELRVVDLASPNASATIVAFPSDERPGAVAWSVEGTGLVYSVTPDSAARGLPAWGALRTVDLAARTPKEVARFDSVALSPLLWDRLGGDLVAGVVARGGVATDYLVVRGVQPPDRRLLPDRKWHATVTGDERWVVIAAEGESVYRTFQADDPTFVVETHGLTDAAVTALGRPMNGDVGIALDGQLILWDPTTGLRRLVPVAEPVTEVVGFRFDGSAALVRTGSGLHLIEIASGKDTPMVSGNVTLGVALP